ncbi:hypothetical protein LNP25_03930 [Klebsiella variicola subsp. variicola]|nr:hypothetical protein [Klebsiella variicola subsp. variicola]
MFLHDCPAEVMTDGEREIDGRQFYLRLAQRIMHLFSTRTSSGILLRSGRPAASFWRGRDAGHHRRRVC